MDLRTIRKRTTKYELLLANYYSKTTLVLCIVGNKIDLEENEEVSYEEASSYAKVNSQ